MPLASGPVSVPDAPPPTAVGAVKGGLLPPKSLEGPLIANATRLRPARLAGGGAAPSGARKPVVPGPAGGPSALRISPLRPASDVDRWGTVCAPGIVMSNSWPVGAWQRVQNASGWGPTRSPWA